MIDPTSIQGGEKRVVTPCSTSLAGYLEGKTESGHSKTKSSSVLGLVCEQDIFNETQVCIDNGFAIDKPDQSGNTPMMQAASTGQSGVIKVLVERGAMWSVDRFGAPKWSIALIIACGHGHLDVVVELVNQKVSIELADNGGYSPLITAAFLSAMLIPTVDVVSLNVRHLESRHINETRARTAHGFTTEPTMMTATQGKRPERLEAEEAVITLYPLHLRRQALQPLDVLLHERAPMRLRCSDPRTGRDRLRDVFVWHERQKEAHPNAVGVVGGLDHDTRVTEVQSLGLGGLGQLGDVREVHARERVHPDERVRGHDVVHRSPAVAQPEPLHGLVRVALEDVLVAHHGEVVARVHAAELVERAQREPVGGVGVVHRVAAPVAVVVLRRRGRRGARELVQRDTALQERREELLRHVLILVRVRRLEEAQQLVHVRVQRRDG
ncbi:hypothetical protein ON010_g11921 [Phytophthora cinnamomi]|nr:hypothetical protein ON010_g11921 [Phytophthora cinnamomi]